MSDIESIRYVFYYYCKITVALNWTVKNNKLCKKAGLLPEARLAIRRAELNTRMCFGRITFHIHFIIVNLTFSESKTFQVGRGSGLGHIWQEIRDGCGFIVSRHVLPSHHPIRGQLQPQVQCHFRQELPSLRCYRLLPGFPLQVLLLQHNPHLACQPHRGNAG